EGRDPLLLRRAPYWDIFEDSAYDPDPFERGQEAARQRLEEADAKIAEQWRAQRDNAEGAAETARADTEAARKAAEAARAKEDADKHRDWVSLLKDTLSMKDTHNDQENKRDKGRDR